MIRNVRITRHGFKRLQQRKSGIANIKKARTAVAKALNHGHLIERCAIRKTKTIKHGKYLYIFSDDNRNSFVTVLRHNEKNS